MVISGRRREKPNGRRHRKSSNNGITPNSIRIIKMMNVYKLLPTEEKEEDKKALGRGWREEEEDGGGGNTRRPLSNKTYLKC